MRTFSGSAVLSLPTGDLEVTADLALHEREPDQPGLSSWQGQLRSDASGDPFFDFFDQGTAMLRIGEREGKLIATKYSVGSGVIVVAGSGPPPFG